MTSQWPGQQVTDDGRSPLPPPSAGGVSPGPRLCAEVRHAAAAVRENVADVDKSMRRHGDRRLSLAGARVPRRSPIQISERPDRGSHSGFFSESQKSARMLLPLCDKRHPNAATDERTRTNVRLIDRYQVIRTQQNVYVITWEYGH